jgi:hypothetical protein
MVEGTSHGLVAEALKSLPRVKNDLLGSPETEGWEKMQDQIYVQSFFYTKGIFTI